MLGFLQFSKMRFLGKGSVRCFLFILSANLLIHKWIKIAMFIYKGILKLKVRRSFFRNSPSFGSKMPSLLRFDISELINKSPFAF